MARSERQAGGTRGGVGTMTRTGTRSRPQQAPDEEQAAPAPRRGRWARPVPQQRPETDLQVLQGQRADAGQRTDPGQRTGGRRGPSTQRADVGARAGGPRRGAPQAVAAPASPDSRPRIAAPWRVPSSRRPEGSQPAHTTGPQSAVPPATAAQAAQAAQAPRTMPAAPQQSPLRRPAAAGVTGAHRMPFVLLLCGLLGGALVSALVISTTLAEGSFQITKLQDSTSLLARQRQTLAEEVAQAQSAQVIEQRASQLGMRRPDELLFVNLKTGKTTNDGPAWVGAVNAPGYAP